MKSKTKRAIRTARLLLSKGILGKDLLSELKSAYPDLSDSEFKRVSSRVKKEIGILGQVAHDPNLFSSCKVASAAKEKHPHPHTLLVTYRTAMCDTCSYNKAGNCGLMGGKILNNQEGITHKIASRTARILQSEGSLDRRSIDQVENSELPPDKKIASLHLRKSLTVINNSEDVKAEADSRKIAALMDKSDQDLVIVPFKKREYAEFSLGKSDVRTASSNALFVFSLCSLRKSSLR